MRGTILADPLASGGVRGQSIIAAPQEPESYSKAHKHHDREGEELAFKPWVSDLMMGQHDDRKHPAQQTQEDESQTLAIEILLRRPLVEAQ